ncbi:hypothetical protein BJ912DRAFT_1138159 [Pholiota molesta]|nr:hypothetical protein BJ912DRAFT_1138159 [Pholiota molesta]
MAQRPRASILSLFDPLSHSPTSDKENNVGETSFFHPPGFPKPSPAQHTLRRRLIDIGDITVDEPDVRHLLEMEVELEELNKHITEDDDGETLTWRDMAKAATPKWSGRHATSFTTPKASPTPRTPLAEISFKDETTPMARKKSYKREIISGPSKFPQVDVTPERSSSVSSSPPLHTSSDETSSLPVSPPSIQISGIDIDVQGNDLTTTQSATLGSSVCTLDLPTPTTDNLLADTSLPLSVSLSSQTSSQSSLSPSTVMSLPHTQVRLRPDSHSKASTDNRLSIDLQSSFQLHLNPSDTSFDLLNEKISFFSSKNGDDSFLKNLEIDDSFGDDDFSDVKPNVGEEMPLKNPPARIDPKPVSLEAINSIPQSAIKSPRPESLRVFVPKLRSPTAFSSGESVVHAMAKPSFNDNHEFHASPTAIVHGPLSAKLPSQLGLRLTKRSRTAFNAELFLFTPTSSEASASSKDIVRPKILPSVSSPTVNSSRDVDAPQLVTAHPTKRSAVSSFANPSLSGDGPRRVLVSEGPKLNSLSRTSTFGHSEPTKASLAANGPRRVVVNSVANVVDKPVGVVKPVAASQVSTGLKPPVKYNTIGPSSCIPKPVSRTAGSRLPAPTSIKSRFGVPTVAASTSTKGLLGRRVT